MTLVDRFRKLSPIPLVDRSGRITQQWLSVFQEQFIADTYTPTFTDVTNLDASTPAVWQYMRVGDVVVVSGRLAVNPTALAATELGISLPIASDFASVEDCAGTAAAIAVQESAGIVADTTNNRASMQWLAASTANHVMECIFQYTIIP